ncbi:hypothetical protein AVEN_1507-1 [Araneus ventricosus]|uniref:Uncharacterized protein n=1 Tax=Araneus ventricosus TaxID=182803 RepID=A0A4Y2GIQ4_ARAVE|nr:hypothetical protein AVEN_1507-1 [Araneus ventricosus]
MEANTIQRPFLLALQENTEPQQSRHSRSHLEFHLSPPAPGGQSHSHSKTNISFRHFETLVPGEVEKGKRLGCTSAECPSEEPISVDGRGITSGTSIYTEDPLEDRKGVRAEFCVWPGQNIVYDGLRN